MITTVYDKATVAGLFDIHLQTTSVRVECLIEELEYLRDSCGSETDKQLLATASKVYEYLKDMADTTEQREIIMWVSSPCDECRRSRPQAIFQEKEPDLQSRQ